MWGTVNIYIARGVLLASSRCFASPQSLLEIASGVVLYRKVIDYSTVAGSRYLVHRPLYALD